MSSNVWSERVLVVSLYALSLSIFLSVSLVAVFQILLLASFLMMTASRKIKFAIPMSAWFLVIFILAQLLSCIWNYSSLQDRSHAIGWAKYPFVALLGALVLQRAGDMPILKRHLKSIGNLFMLTVVLAFVYGFVKVYGGYDLLRLKSGDYGSRLGGFTDIMRYGYGSAIVLLVLIGCTLNYWKIRFVDKKILIAVSIVCGLGLILSYTRGALLGFLVALPTMVYLYRKSYGYWIAGIASAIIALLVSVALMGGSHLSRFFMSATSSSNTIRLSQYEAAWRSFLENPVVGLGPLQLKYHVKDIKERYDLPHKEYVNEHSHNVFLEMLANVGLLGFVAFIGWLFFWLVELLKKGSLYRQIFVPVVVFILVAGQFEMLFMAQTSTLLYFLYSVSLNESLENGM